MATLPKPMPLVECVSVPGDAAVGGEKKNSGQTHTHLRETAFKSLPLWAALMWVNHP